MTNEITPQCGDHILTKKNPYTINKIEGIGDDQKCFCGHTTYFTYNLKLVSKGGTKKYPVRTWKYIGNHK